MKIFRSNLKALFIHIFILVSLNFIQQTETKSNIFRKEKGEKNVAAVMKAEEILGHKNGTEDINSILEV